MKTLKQLQDAMQAADIDAARAAAVELANFYIIYNDEYNALQDTLVETHGQYIVATQGSAGVDHPRALELRALELSLTARMALLDEKMRAFHMSDMKINPPSRETVARVKALSGQVAALNGQATAIDAVTKALTDMATIVNQSF